MKTLIVIMGISGSGKSTLGKAIAERLGFPFIDADDFHPRENVTKMSRGIPLNDDDRWPWLAAIGNYVIESHRDEYVLACSALKETYRDYLDQRTNNTYLYLEIDEATAIKRMNKREGHFMQAEMVTSQLATLEPPKNALTISCNDSIDQQTTLALKHLGN